MQIGVVPKIVQGTVSVGVAGSVAERDDETINRIQVRIGNVVGHVYGNPDKLVLQDLVSRIELHLQGITFAVVKRFLRTR